MAPLVKELESRAEIQSICCITAQHRQMLDDVLQLFAIQPDYDLDIMEARQSLYTITSKCLLGMEEVFSREKPDLVLVHGDTSTTFSGALAAFYQKIAVGHVEAGLRTWDKYSPFPEEMNRTLVGDLAEFHFCPTQANRENLLREGLREGIFVTGNTVIDALKTTVRPDYRFRSQLLNTLDYTRKQVILVTCHRRENYGQPMTNIMRALRRIVEDFPQVELVYPVHLSPVVQEAARAHLSGHDRIHLIEPLTPDEMHNVMARSAFVMTDSGGLQEEAPALGRPVLVLRRETERPEAVAAGTVLLAGTEEDVIYGHAARPGRLPRHGPGGQSLWRRSGLPADCGCHPVEAGAAGPAAGGILRRMMGHRLEQSGKGVGCVPWTRRTGPFWSSPLR